MKKSKKILSLFLALLTILSCFSTMVFAEETTEAPETTVPEDNSITVKMMNYNVAGMPNFSGKDVPACQEFIGKYVVENGFDIFATQEDFGYNRTLYKSLTGFDYRSCHTGSIPGGDGLNIYTKTMPIYNEHREQWFQAYGSISEGDLLTPKGLMYAAIDIGDGIIIDFYNMHADAFDTLGSREARYSNYMQLATLIEQNYVNNNRPVIVTGDFNHYLHATEVNSDQYKIFHQFCELKDAWIEIHNDGNYKDFSKWHATGLSPWGNWDSVEKFLYKDGGGVTVEILSQEFKWIKDEAGADISDHAAAEVTFKFTKTDAFVENTQELEVKKLTDPLSIVINMIRWIFKDLGYILSHINELLEFLK